MIKIILSSVSLLVLACPAFAQDSDVKTEVRKVFEGLRFNTTLDFMKSLQQLNKIANQNQDIDIPCVQLQSDYDTLSGSFNTYYTNLSKIIIDLGGSGEFTLEESNRAVKELTKGCNE